MRDIVILACEECKRRNYTTTKNKRNQPGRISYRKFCPNCRKHTEHKQTK